MKHLRSLKGVGTLLVLEDRYDGIEYAIDIWEEPNGMKRGGGKLTGPGQVIWDAFNSNGGVVLQLDGGRTVDLVVSNLGPDGTRDVQLSGPVPGF